MVLFTPSSTSVQYMILGRLQADYALVLMLTGLLAALLGNTFDPLLGARLATN